MTDTTPAADRPADLLRAAAEKLRAARFSGAITATPTVAALIGARLPLAAWLEAEAAPPITAQHSDRCTDPQCTTLAALAVARQLLGTTDTKGAPDVVAALGDGGVRCPLCPGQLMLHTPSGARAHFTHVHPEQQISGRQGPWPVLIPAAPPAPADRAAMLREAADELDAAFGDPMVTHVGKLGASFLRRRAREIEAEQATSPSRPVDEEQPGAERHRPPCVDGSRCGDTAHCPPAPADRAAVLREAADTVEALPVPDTSPGRALGAAWALDQLRRLADHAAAGVQPPTTSEAHPPSYPWSQSVHSVDGGQTIHITWDDPEGNPGGSVRVDASDRNVLAFMLADGAPDPADAPDAPSVRCSVANLRRWPHPPHSWEPQPGMPLVRCPGTPPAAPAAPRIRCAHTDVVYGQCIRYLDDHDGDCQHEQQPAAPAAPEETQ